MKLDLLRSFVSAIVTLLIRPVIYVLNLASEAVEWFISLDVHADVSLALHRISRHLVVTIEAARARVRSFVSLALGHALYRGDHYDPGWSAT